MATYTTSSTWRSNFKNNSNSDDTYVVDTASKGLILTGKSDGDTIQIDGLSTDYTFQANANWLTVASIANPLQKVTLDLSMLGGTAGDTLQFNDGDITADYVPATTGVKAAIQLISANDATVTLSGYSAMLADAGSTLLYATSSTHRSHFKDNSNSDDTYVVGTASKGLVLTGKSDGDTIQIDGLSTDYTFKASGNTLTVTSIADPQQSIVLNLSKLADTAGDTLQFNDGNIIADYLPKVGHTHSSLILTGEGDETVTLTSKKATLESLDSQFQSIDVTAPTMSSAVIAADGNSIVVTYSEALTGTPEAGDYAITLGSGTTTVTGATIGSGANANQVTLALGTYIDTGDTASISYTAAAGIANSIIDAAAVPNNAADQTLASGSVTDARVFTLTTGVDNFSGTSGNDTFMGTYDAGIATDTFGFAGNDILNGAGGTGDTLHIDHLIDVAITMPDVLWTNLSNIEKIEINTTGSGAQTLTTGSAFNTAFAAGVDLTMTTAGAGAINVTMDTFTGAATITTTSIAGAQTIVTGSGITTADATSDAGALTIYGAGLATAIATTTGAGAQTIGDALGGGANLVTVTAAANSGAQTITSTSTSDVTVNATSTAGLQTIITGAGNDTVTATAVAGQSDTITTNAGDDTIVSSLSDDLITGGLGTDSMTGGGGTDTFVFGAEGSIVGTSMDVITDFNAVGADIFDFGATTNVLVADATALVAGLNVQTTAGGMIIFDAADDTLAEKILAVQADIELDAAGAVAMFADDTHGYLYYAGLTPGDADDQLIQLSDITLLGLTTITAGDTLMFA